MELSDMSQRSSIDLQSGVDECGEFPKAMSSTNPVLISANGRLEEIENQNTGKKIIV